MPVPRSAPPGSPGDLAIARRRAPPPPATTASPIGSWAPAGGRAPSRRDRSTATPSPRGAPSPRRPARAGRAAWNPPPTGPGDASRARWRRRRPPPTPGAGRGRRPGRGGGRSPASTTPRRRRQSATTVRTAAPTSSSGSAPTRTSVSVRAPGPATTGQAPVRARTRSRMARSAGAMAPRSKHSTAPRAPTVPGAPDAAVAAASARSTVSAKPRSCRWVRTASNSRARSPIRPRRLPMAARVGAGQRRSSVTASAQRHETAGMSDQLRQPAPRGQGPGADGLEVDGPRCQAQTACGQHGHAELPDELVDGRAVDVGDAPAPLGSERGPERAARCQRRVGGGCHHGHRRQWVGPFGVAHGCAKRRHGPVVVSRRAPPGVRCTRHRGMLRPRCLTSVGSWPADASGRRGLGREKRPGRKPSREAVSPGDALRTRRRTEAVARWRRCRAACRTPPGATRCS